MSLLDKISGALGGSILGGIKELITTFKLPPEQAAQFELKMQETEAQINLAILKHDADVIQAVNATMQAEAKSEHWMQWSWRPFIGFTFAAVIINNFILLPYFRSKGLMPIEIPADVWSAMLVILGASALTRGWQKVERVRKAK